MQTLTITINFKAEHNPGSDTHLEEVARAYFKGKGVVMEGRTITI